MFLRSPTGGMRRDSALAHRGFAYIYIYIYMYIFLCTPTGGYALFLREPVGAVPISVLCLPVRVACIYVVSGIYRGYAVWFSFLNLSSVWRRFLPIGCPTAAVKRWWMTGCGVI